MFPALIPDIAINEWGLVKILCRCTNTLTWSHRTPPTCRICQRNRDEKIAAKEEKRQKLITATEEEYEKKAYSVEMSEELMGVKVNGSSDSCIIYEKVACDDIQNQAGRQRI